MDLWLWVAIVTCGKGFVVCGKGLSWVILVYVVKGCHDNAKYAVPTESFVFVVLGANKRSMNTPLKRSILVTVYL